VELVELISLTVLPQDLKCVMKDLVNNIFDTSNLKEMGWVNILSLELECNNFPTF